MTDKVRINKAYGLLKGATENAQYTINGNKIPLPITIIEEILSLLNDKNYDLVATAKDTP